MKLTKQRLKEIIKEEIRNLREGKRRQLQIPIIDKRKVDQIMKKLRFKIGKDYDFGVGKGATFILDLDRKYQNKVLELFIKNRINVQGA